jgi:sigma-B regulation protein RsbU (phosphoserine phosphatase)
MTGQNLILIRDGRCPADAAVDRARTLLDQCPPASAFNLTTASTAEVLNDPAIAESAHIAWVMVDEADDGELFEVIGTLQDRHVPTLLTRRNERATAGTPQQDGVVVCPPGTPAAVVVALLQGLRSQVPVLRAMKSELKLLRAHQGGLCDQIGRIDEELRLAAQLQREFLPKSMVAIGDVAFRVLFRPAGYVSGDIYDVVRLDEKHIGFFLADAVGHGVPAALLTMFIKRSLVTKRLDPGNPRGYRLTEPGEALEKLNRDLVEQQGGQVRFATACYGVVNCETLEVCLARAGHPFPIHLRADGTTQTLEPEGGLLGVFAEETYEQTRLQLSHGDRLLLYSDGFEMAFPPEELPKGRAPDPRGKRVASTRYTREFEDLRQGTPDDAILRLQEKLDHQAGSLNQRDDLSLVCLSVAERPAAQSTTDAQHAAAA